MANPYEWSDERDDRSRRHDPVEQDARRAAERRAEQERLAQDRADHERADRAREDRERQWDRGPQERQGGDFGAGWYGEDAFYEGYGAPGPYGRPSEQRARHPHEHRSFEEEAREAGRKVARGWRRLTEGARHTFEDDRGPAERDPRHGGGMFGGQDRSQSLFSHDDGLGLGRRPGEHRGKGPRGYVRGDERILEEVCDRLTDDDRLDASGIEVRIEAGEVTLNGQVRSREDKRRAEDLAEQVSGVKHLQNNLRVRPPEQQPAPPAASPAVQAAAPTSAQITDQRIAAPRPGTTEPPPPSGEPPRRPN